MCYSVCIFVYAPTVVSILWVFCLPQVVGMEVVGDKLLGLFVGGSCGPGASCRMGGVVELLMLSLVLVWCCWHYLVLVWGR